MVQIQQTAGLSDVNCDNITGRAHQRYRSHRLLADLHTANCQF